MADILRITVQGELIMNNYFISRFKHTKNNNLGITLHEKNIIDSLDSREIRGPITSHEKTLTTLSIRISIRSTYTLYLFVLFKRRWSVTLV